MSLLSGVGIVLRRSRHLEDDVRLTFFSRDLGKLVLIAKGTSKLSSRIRILQEPFSEVDAQIFVPAQGFHARLINGKLLSSHPGLSRTLARFEAAAKCCETVDLLLPFRAAAPDVYDILRGSLQSLQTTEWPQIEWIHYVVRLMRCLGHGDLSAEAEKTLKLGRAEDVRRCLSFLEAQLGQILPRPLKSEVLKT